MPNFPFPMTHPETASAPFEKALAMARKPEKMFCPECNDHMFSPMDKLSIHLYGKCLMHLEEGSVEEKNILTLIEAL